MKNEIKNDLFELKFETMEDVIAPKKTFLDGFEKGVVVTATIIGVAVAIAT